MDRQDIIFSKMLSYKSSVLGAFTTPCVINKNTLQEGLRLGTPKIMQNLKEWIICTKENRMIVFSTKCGSSWAIMNTDRVSLDQKRNIYWIFTQSDPLNWLQGNDQVWITIYRD